MTVVVVSDDLAFLTAFAELSLEHRLLVWSTRLLVLTRLSLQQVRRLLSSYWTFSMMNTMILNQQQVSSGSRYIFFFEVLILKFNIVCVCHEMWKYIT